MVDAIETGTRPEAWEEPSRVLSSDGPARPTLDEVLDIAWGCHGVGLEVAEDAFSWMEREGWTWKTRRGTEKIGRGNIHKVVAFCAKEKGCAPQDLPVKDVYVVSYPDQETYLGYRPQASPDTFQEYNRQIIAGELRKAERGAYWPRIHRVDPRIHLKRDPRSQTISPEELCATHHAASAGL